MALIPRLGFVSGCEILDPRVNPPTSAGRRGDSVPPDSSAYLLRAISLAPGVEERAEAALDVRISQFEGRANFLVIHRNTASI